MMNRIRLAAGLLILLSACLPVQPQAVTSVALLNGPSEYRVAGLAEHFEETLKTQPEAARYGFSPSGALRYQETHRDLYGSRAPLQAAFAARAQGAAYAVLIGVPTDVSIADVHLSKGQLEVKLEISGRAQAIIIEAETAATLGTFSSAPFKTTTVETVTFALPEGVDPESVEGQRLTEQRAHEVKEAAEISFSDGFEPPLSELAPPVAGELARLIAQGQ